MFDHYLELGGTEVVNTARANAYLDRNAPQIPVPARARDRFKTLHLALGEPEYESPRADGAPWLDESNPATARFYGVIGLGVQGVDGSTLSATAEESIGNGGVVGAQRFASRAIRVKALLVAEDELALDAGQTWLSAALQASECSDHGGSCGGARFCYYAAEPCIVDEWEPTYEAGFGTPLSTNVAGGRLIIREPNSDALFKAWFDAPGAAPTSSPDGVVVKWGTVLRDATTVEVESYGPIVRRRTNLFPRPNMLADDALTFWAGSTASIDTTTGDGPGGRPYMSVDAPGGTGTKTSSAANPVPALSGKHIVSLALRAAAPGTTVTVSLRDPATPTTVYTTATFIVGDLWQTYSFPVADVPQSVMRITANDLFDFNDVMVEVGSIVFPYLDGNSTPAQAAGSYVVSSLPADQQYTVAWVGVPNKSASVLTFTQPLTVGMPFGEEYLGFGGGVCDVWPFIETLQGEISGGSAIFSLRFKLQPWQQALPYERTMHDVTVIQGPVPIEDLPVRSGGAMRIVEWTMVAGRPWAFSSTQLLLDNRKMSDLSTLPWPSAEQCEPDTGPAPIIDPDCLIPPSPPSPPEIPTACIIDEPILYRYWLPVDAEDVSVWSDMVPRVTIQSGEQEIRQMRVRAYPNPFGRDVLASLTQYRNGARNPKFEVDTADWTSAGGTFARNPTDGPNSEVQHHVRLTVVGTPAATAVLIQNGSTTANAVKVTPGERIRPVFYVRTSTSRNVKVIIRFVTAAGATVGDAIGTNAAMVAGTWQLVGMNGTTTVPATAAYAYIWVTGDGAAWAAGQTLDVAALNAQIYATGAPTPADLYWDGSSQYFSDGLYRGWGGDPGLSISYATASPVDPCSWCSEFIVSYLPARTELTVDAILERAFASVSGSEAQPADTLLYATDGGPMTWPALSCGIDYLFAFDVPQPLLDDVRITFELTRKA